MAASIRSRGLLKNSHISLIISHRKATSSTRGYYVLLPEVPPDTAQDNPLLAYDSYPHFNRITPDKAVTAAAKLAIDYDVKLGSHLSNIREKKISISFASVFDPIEKLSVPLNFGWRTVKQLNYVKGGDFPKAFQRVNQQVEQAKNERWLSNELYNAVKEVKASKCLNESERRLVDLYLLEGKLNGVELTGEDKTKFLQTLHQLSEYRSSFRQRVIYSTGLFSHNLTDFSVVEQLPRGVAAAMAVNKHEPHRGPWKISLNDGVYEPFMTHCVDRKLRANVWTAYNSRCSYTQQTENLSNSKTIQDIRRSRNYLASVVGYSNFAQMSMETKMAASVENVQSLCLELTKHCLPAAQQELSLLQEYATSEGFRDKLQSWDIAFWRHRHANHLFKVDEAIVSQYFPLAGVFQKLCDLCTTMFGIVIKDCSGQVSTWHDDVKFYKVYEKQDAKELGSFYFDPYSRQNKLNGNWADPCRERSELLGCRPVSFINMNLTRPVSSLPALLTVRDVASLLACFGQALQQLLTTVSYSEVAGQRNIEWDTILVAPYVLSSLLYTQHVMTLLSGHYETGQPLPTDMVHTLIQAEKYFSANDLMKQVYISALEIELCTSKDAWQDVMRRVWKVHMPLPLHADDNHPCSSTFLFIDHPTVSCYAPVWSKMLAADIVGQFSKTEAGQDALSHLASVGHKFRSTYLSLGGSASAADVFKRFQGRAPAYDALVQRVVNR